MRGHNDVDRISRSESLGTDFDCLCSAFDTDGVEQTRHRHQAKIRIIERGERFLNSRYIVGIVPRECQAPAQSGRKIAERLLAELRGDGGIARPRSGKNQQLPRRKKAGIDNESATKCR
jgi:hypothetical protein